MKKTTKNWAEIDGLNIRTAQACRKRLNLGEKTGVGYLLTEIEWNHIKKNIRTGISQSDFARIAGVSRMTVCNLIKDNKLIKNENSSMDMENEVNKNYLEGRK